jgi:hypothetical protein
MWWNFCHFFVILARFFKNIENYQIVWKMTEKWQKI